MKSQIFVAIGVALVASVLITGLASTIYAQSNMTGGNMTGTAGDGGGNGDGDDDDGDVDADSNGGDGGSDGQDDGEDGSN